MKKKLKAILEEIQVNVWHVDSMGNLIARFHTELVDAGLLRVNADETSDPFLSIADIVREKTTSIVNKLDLIEEWLNTGSTKQLMLIQGVTIEHQAIYILRDIQINVWHVDSMAYLLGTLYYDLIASGELDTSKSVTSEPFLSISDIVQEKAKLISEKLDLFEELLDAGTVKQQKGSAKERETTIN
jgi:hypothetical protein